MNKNKTPLITESTLNLIFAVSAVLISAASFYATYLQAEAAEQQVKAMTMPIVQFEHGNYNSEDERHELYFEVKNAGVGPALIKSVTYRYNGEDYAHVMGFIKACCKVPNRDTPRNITMITGDVQGLVIGAGEEDTLMSMALTDDSEELWRTINQERFKMDVEVCFCSLLEECFVSKRNFQPQPVASCPVRKGG